MKKFIPLLAAFVLATTLRADVKLPAIIGDNMVLQADKPLPVWGWASPGEKVTVSLLGENKEVTAGQDGKWMVKLEAKKAGGPVEMNITGKNKLTLKNILIGEVWVCSGQSNMGYTFDRAHNASVESSKANNPKIRLFKVPRVTAFSPQEDAAGKWEECDSETVKNFTAVGYFFGRDIQKALGVPVGLINTSWGGTPAQAWTSIEGLKSEAALEGYVKSYTDTSTNLDKLKENHQKVTLPKYEAALKAWQETTGKEHRENLAKWQKEVAAAKAAGKEAPPQPKPAKAMPRKPDEPGKSPHVPSVLYNGMIQPLVPFAIRGAIWYQGESNAGTPVLYQTLFPTMIKDWRRVWGQNDNFPFLFVQLANYMKRESEPTQGEGGWPGLREAQNMTLSLPNTGQAVIIDIGEADDIHPQNKDTVGQRLALAGLKVAYGQNVAYSGPTYDSMAVEGNKVRVKFKNAGGGLMIGAAPAIRLNEQAKKPAEKLIGFAVAGEDKKFVWANAQIDGDSVLVWADGIAKPVAVRYAWANNPACNLYNKEGLPASPFRTDTWTSPAPQGAKK